MNSTRNKPKLFKNDSFFSPMAKPLFCLAIALQLFFSGPATAVNKAPEIVSDIIPSDPVPASDIKFIDSKGESKKLSDFEGNVRIINFWALWCLPCKQEMPSLSKLQQEYGDKGLKVIAIANSTEGVRQIKAYYKKNRINALDIFIDDGNNGFKAFSLKGLPTSIIINKNGEAVARVSGYNDWESKKTKAFIEKLLAE